MNTRDGGLTIELYLGNPRVDANYNDEDGIFMSIHNQSEVPFSRNPNIKIAAGSSNSLTMKKIFVTKLKLPAGLCMNDGFSSDLYDFITKTLNVNYSQEYCFSLCVQQQYISTCNCTQLTYPPVALNSTVRACTIFTDNICGRSVLRIIQQPGVVANCNTKCPLECNQIEYEINSFQARYPTDFYIQYLYNKTQAKGFSVNLTDIYKTFSKIEISLGAMFYKIATQTRQYNLPDLIGLLGGVVSFWIGGGLLSLFEIIHLGFDITKTLIKYYIIKKQISTNILPSDQKV